MSGDYTKAAPWFKVRKVARYVRLFGIARTMIKVRAQYHMKADEGFDGAQWQNPACHDPAAAGRNTAIIGCGNYAFANLAYYLRKLDQRFLRATHDTNRTRARSLCQAYRGGYAVADWRDIVADPKVKLVFISSNHASHAEYAIACLEAGKHVHIEKPHVVTDDQLARLETAMAARPDARVFLGFNRPRSVLFRQLQSQLSRQAGPLMINWFIAGHEIPAGHWYFNDKEGGRVLGNLCHWTDLTLHLVGLENAFPCQVIPATAKGAQSDFAVSVIFADHSSASITFSAKGHTFEGVREVLNLHRGNLLANITDFQHLTMDVVEKKVRRSLWHRDHGHFANISNSFEAVRNEQFRGERLAYVVATARFFLAIREAIESGRTVDIPDQQLIRTG